MQMWGGGEGRSTWPQKLQPRLAENVNAYYRRTEGFMQELGYYPNSRDSKEKKKELEMETGFGLVWDRM